MRRVSAHGMRQLKMRSGSAQREAQVRGAQSAKREAQSAEREARSAKRVRDKYIYIRPGRLLQRAACVRLSSVSNGATSLGRQGHRASPAAPATQGACTELEPRRGARKESARAAGRSLKVASVPESGDNSERAGDRSFFRTRRSQKRIQSASEFKVSIGRNAVLTEDLLGDASAACGHSRLPARVPPN